jgi:CRISPR-associated protein (TIGR03984 family)
VRNNVLMLSSDAFPPSDTTLTLRWHSLQQLRLFGETGELFVWRSGDTFKARVQTDSKAQVGAIRTIDEEQMLWGYSADTAYFSDGFWQLQEGTEGIQHAPPISNATTGTSRAKLKVRHYLGEDDAGVVRITGSRLVALVEEEGNNGSKT